jgi:hypothetical protein
VTPVTRESWLARHPYLQPVASLRALVESAAAQVSETVIREPDWQDYQPDFQAGIPPLDSERAAVSVSDPVNVVLSMLDALLSMPLPAALGDQGRALQADLKTGSTGGESPVHSGLFRCLLWASSRAIWDRSW